MVDAALKNMNLNTEEVGRLTKAMKDPKFMELLTEYAQEISEPTTHEVFINICSSDKIAKPKSSSRVDGSGEQWEIPYSLGPIHKDKDKDFVLPKLKYKGPSKNPKILTVSSSRSEKENMKAESAEEKKNKKSKCAQEKENISNNTETGHEYLVEPKYELVYRSGLDLGKFWMDTTNLSALSEKPKEILLRVHLPQVTSAGEVDLDVSKQEVLLTTLGKYKLKVALKYLVDFSKGRAQFDKSTKRLEVILPIVSTPSSKDTS